ncbi:MULTISPECIES: M23 family metallopeptidase [unclassified Streptomyces]|uniref:M23 family metallopeptidase n=1 Tax=unclassified Streptomyces TaxID=2593676 RepID=UPI00224EA996|nr:M23 family metallopeptidase [Streptomyces sp. NBC_00063]MCX5438820.1 M23 family metallopeptidase [Streptomyces sp. NBC_00063]WSE16409.1 M23 family metallopeptidase [Streptomyces sp. NBC_01397]
MSKRTMTLSSGSSKLRTRAAVVTVAMGATALLGAGAAVAAESTQGSVALPSVAAASVKAQAKAQAKAAEQAKVHAAQVKVHAAQVKKAAAKKAVSWIDPVKSYKLSASFGLGGNMWSHKHSGQDFAVPIGTNVMAVHGGTVVKAGGNGAGDGPAYGNAIVIKHSDGTYSQYAHLSRVDVHVGQTVSTGQHIALSGNTGNSSGPHLHFEIRTTPNYGSAVNPVNFLKSVGVAV